MRTKGYGIALLGAAFGAFAALGCADLSQIQENTCGNGLVEVGEDCDSKATADGADCSADSSTCACRQHGELNECRFRCDQASDCPADGLGWGCGIDHVCRRPRVCKGTLCDRWESAALLPETASQVIIADFDGSGRGSLLSVASPLVSVHSFDESGRLLDSDVLVVPDANPAVGDLTSPDPSAPPDLFPTHDFVVDVSRGIEVFRGSTDSVMQPTIYASQALPVLGRAQSFSFLDDSLHAPAVLFFPQDADGKTSSIQGFESGSAIATLGTVPVAGKLAGDAVVAPFYNTLFPPFPCDQFAVTFEEAKGVRVYTPCKADGTLNEEGKPGYVQPALITLPIGSTIRKDAQGLFVVDADKDGTPDLLISVDDAIGGASSLCLAFSRGDGTFSSTPDKAVPADNKAALYPVHTALAQPEQVRKHLHDAPLAVGDINNDCAIDFVNQFGIYLSAIGKGSCFKPDTFFTLSVVEDEHVWTSAAVDDFSADGLLDVMVGSINTPGLTFYKGTGTNLLNPFKLVTQSGVKTFAVGDFDGDFVRDLAFTQSGEVDVDGSVHESIAVVYGGIAGGPTQPIVMGETSPIRQLLPTNVLGIYPDFITDLLGLATDHTGKGLELSLFPGNSGRLLQAPYYLINDSSQVPDFPSQFAVGQFDGDPHNDIAAFGRQLCFGAGDCGPQLWLVPTTGAADIEPGGTKGAPAPTALPLVADGEKLEDIQGGALLATVRLGPTGGDGPATDQVVVVVGGSPPLLYVATPSKGAFKLSPKVPLEKLGDSRLRELSVTVADVDGERGADVIVASKKGMLVLWNQGSGGLDAGGDHASFLSPDDLGQIACDGAQASASILGVGSIAADADPARELLVSTGRVTYLVDQSRGKLAVSCLKGLPGGNAIAGGDVNGDGVDDLVIGRKGALELFLAQPADPGLDLTVGQ